MNLHIYQLKNDGLVMSFMKTKLQTATMFNTFFFFLLTSYVCTEVHVKFSHYFPFFLNDLSLKI